LIPEKDDFRALAKDTRLTGLREGLHQQDDLPEMSISISLTPLVREEVLFDIPESHNPYQYETLFGDDYWPLLLAHYFERRSAAIEPLLQEKLNFKESATGLRLKQFDALIGWVVQQDNYYELLATVDQLVRKKTASVLVQQGSFGIVYLMCHRVSLIKLFSVAQLENYIDRIITSREPDRIKIILLFIVFISLSTVLDSLAYQIRILPVLLDLLCQNNEDDFYKLTERAKSQIGTNLELQKIVKNRIIALGKTLGKEGDNLDLVNQESINQIHNIWFDCSSDFNVLKQLIDEKAIEGLFPADKYVFYSHLIRKLLIKPGVSIYELMEWFCPYVAPEEASDVSEYERLLIEIICIFNNRRLGQCFLELIERSPVNRPGWRNTHYGSMPLLMRAALYNNLFLVSEILCETMVAQSDQNDVGRALRGAAWNKRWAIVEHILQLKGANKPNQADVGYALKCAVKAGQWPLVMAISRFTEDNQPDKVAVEEVLVSATYEGEWGVVDAIIRLTGGNKPSEQLISWIIECWDTRHAGWRWFEPDHDGASLSAFTTIFANVLTIRLYPFLLTTNSAGLNAIMWAYKQLVDPSATTQDLKSGNLCGFLYALFLQAQDRADQKTITRMLLSFAETGKHPEAWMALAMIANAWGQTAAAEKKFYIDNLDNLKKAFKPARFFGLFEWDSYEKMVVHALLMCDTSLIKESADTRNIIGFIQSYSQEIQSVRGLTIADATHANGVNLGSERSG
jgi:hypothetical protein